MTPGTARRGSRAHAPAAPTRTQERRLARGWLDSRILSKLSALCVLLLASGLLYDIAMSGAYRVEEVFVLGNDLLSAEEVAEAAHLGGTPTFHVRRAEAAARVEQLPAVADAEVWVHVDGRAGLRIVEKEAVAVWLVGEQPYLVDQRGLVLAARQPVQPLPLVHAVEAQPLRPGDMVSADAVVAAVQIAERFPDRLGRPPGRLEYSEAGGLHMVEEDGRLIHFGTSEHLAQKIEALAALEAHLAQDGERPRVVDLRYRGHAFYQLESER